MSRRPSAHAKGFSLIEVLIVVAIIGIIASMLIPNMLDAMQKAKQKRTMADMRIVGGAMFSWLTDQVGAAAAGLSSTSNIDLGDYGGLKTADALSTILIPTYLQDIPLKDGWKSRYEYYLNTANPRAIHVMAIRSTGRDGAAETDDYTVTGFEPTDYDRDVVWADGFMVRWPESRN